MVGRLGRSPLWRIGGALLCAAAMAGCSLFFKEPASHDEDGITDSISDAEIQKGLAADGSKFVPVWGYKYGDKGLQPGAEKFLKDEYAEWKAQYVVSAGGSALRVQRDYGNGKTPYDTVSEGQAYGMLLAVYFDDKTTFDGLLQYAQAHAAYDGYLMHWYVRADGVNISEFWQPIPHGNPYYKVTYGNSGWLVSNYKTPTYYFDPPADQKLTKYCVAKKEDWKREASNATDADLDMATALIFAFKRWGIDYKNHAVKIVKAVINNDLEEYAENGTTKYIVKNGHSWGGRDGWNPSYYTPAYWKLYRNFIYNNKGDFTGAGSKDYYGICASVISNMNQHMQFVSNGNNAGLFPDWVVTDLTAKLMNRAYNSDRLYFQYYFNNVYDAVVDYNGDGTINANDEIKLQSCNFYYDAVRVPWRLALSYSWYGDTVADGMTDKMANFFKGKIDTFVDGYAYNGGAWNWDHRDGFNYGKPRARTAGDVPSITFLSMLQTAFLNNDRAEAKKWYDKLKGNQETDPNYHYYGNSLRMMSLLYMSGYMVNLYECKTYDESKAPVVGKIYRIRNRASPTSYLTLDGVDKADKIVHWKSLDGDITNANYQKALWKLVQTQINGSNRIVLVSQFGTGNPTNFYLMNDTDNYVKRIEQSSAPNTSYGWTISSGNSAGYYHLVGSRGTAYLKNNQSSHVMVETNSIVATQYADWEFELVE